MKLGYILLILLTGFWLLVTPVYAQSHPFLLFDTADIQDFQSKAAHSPWKELKQQALTQAPSAAFNPNAGNVEAQSQSLQSAVETLGLAYLLDPDHRSTYLPQIISTLQTAWPVILPQMDCYNWIATIPPGNALFASTIVLDLIYPDLTPAQKTSLAAAIRPAADWFYSNACYDSWAENRHAAYGIWALYSGDTARISSAKQGYRQRFDAQITADGIFVNGPGYAWHRLSGFVYTKNLFMDVLEHTGQASYYSDPKYQKLFEWLYGSSVSFKNHKFTFGDTAPEFWDGIIDLPPLYRAGRFSAAAAGYAAWNLTSFPPDNPFLYYLYYQPLPEPVLPPSQIYSQGMAVFRDNLIVNQDFNLSGALWSPVFEDYPSHSHKDMNAIHLSGFGEDLLRNSGYAGWGNGCAGSSWDYVSNYAPANNTLTVSNQDHASKTGGGISGGLITPHYQFATGNSGQALASASHYRHFAFVPTQADYGGYFALLDEITAPASAASFQLYFHPASAVYDIVTPSQEFRWTIRQYSPQNAYLSIATDQNPQSAAFADGGLCAQVSGYTSLKGKYLTLQYPLSQGNGSALTLLFPHQTTAKPVITRLTHAAYSGLSLDYATSARDILLRAHDPQNLIIHDQVTSRAKFTHYRVSNDRLNWFFVITSNHFRFGGDYGFASDHHLTLTQQEAAGQVSAAVPAAVTFYFPQIQGVNLNGSPLTAVNSGPGWLQVAVPAGSHTFTLTTSNTTPVPSPTPTPTLTPSYGDGDGDTDWLDFLYVIRYFGQSYTLFDFNRLVNSL